jgi:hypothetical protein
MNYLLNIWRVPILILYSAFCFVVALTLSATIFKLSDRLKMRFLKIAAILSLIGGFAFVIIFYFAINNYFNDGKIRQLYILTGDDGPRLAVWLTRVDGLGLADYYSHRLKTFDLEKGRLLARLDLAKREGVNDYKLFEPFEGKAFADSKKTGVRLLNLLQAKVLFNEAEILRRNPELGSNISAVAFDSLAKSLAVTTIAGKNYNIGLDLDAFPATERTRTKIHYVPDWIFFSVQGTRGKALHARQVKPSAHSAILLSAKIIEEWDKRPIIKDKVWVEHRSSFSPRADTLISYLDASGKELTRIDLKEILNKKDVYVLATLTRNNEAFVFVTAAGYNLTALRFDPETGKMIGKVSYF